MTKLTAGPTPDGGFVTRRTDNEYTHAVVVLDTTERRWVKNWSTHPEADEFGYVPNPNLNRWVSFSWHGRYDLAAKGVEKARRLGYRAVVVPVQG